MVRWLLLSILLLAGCSSAGRTTPTASKEPADRGDRYGDVLFPAPDSTRSSVYLGLTNPAAPFRVSQVRSGLLVVEIFDMYCIYCQRAAPEVNRLYREIERAGLTDRIKVVGVGRKNSEIEVEVFRERYDVPFPLFPDPSLSLTGALGARKAGTPHFVVLDLREAAIVVDSHTGPFGDPKAFLHRIRNLPTRKEP